MSNPYRLLRTIIIITITIIVPVVITSCKDRGQTRRHTPDGSAVDHRKPLAWGHEGTIYVFADDRVWYYAEQPLRESIERYYWTTENETFFELKRADMENIAHFYRFKNLIFLAHLDSEREVSKYVKGRLTENVLNSVKGKGTGLFYRNNLWANEQFVLFLLGDSEENLLRQNIMEADKVFELFKDKLYSYTKTRVYAIDVYPQSLFSELPYTLQLPNNYIIYKQAKSDNFLSFIARRRNNPDRYISIYYEEMAEDGVNLDWIYSTRERLAWQYYDEDEFNKEDTRLERITLAGYEGIKLAGRWQNRKYAVGGAFQTFSFYDAETKSAVLIDNSVFYPEGSKLPALIETEVISRSIKLKAEDGQGN